MLEKLSLKGRVKKWTLVSYKPSL